MVISDGGSAEGSTLEGSMKLDTEGDIVVKNTMSRVAPLFLGIHKGLHQNNVSETRCNEENRPVCSSCVVRWRSSLLVATRAQRFSVESVAMMDGGTGRDSTGNLD